MKSLMQLSALTAIAIAASGATWFLNDPKPPAPPICDPAKIKNDEICFDQIPPDALWIDARSRAEWKSNGYPGSILWNLDPSEDALKMEAEGITKAVESKLIVVYCTSKACDTSRQIAAKIRSFDPNLNVKILYGGHPSIPSK